MDLQPLSESDNKIVPVESIARLIFLIRGQKVMLDSDLAALYQVPTKRLNEAVKRNLSRFPEDFMMQLSLEEAISSRSQFATMKRGQNIKYLPYVFTEHGVVMLSAVLSSEVAVNMSIDIVRAFVRLRELLATDQEFAFRLEQLEASVDRHTSVINILAEDISHLQTLPEPRKLHIGF